MKSNYPVITFCDLLSHAVSIGYNWNQAHAIIIADGILPMYESPIRELYLHNGSAYGWSEDSIKIIDGFMEKHNLTQCSLIGD